ncbi:MAG: hypothetical protein WBB28_23195 [Crinalium sp.]
MITIKLLGKLGQLFGRIHYFEINTPAEAVRALSANFKNFRKYLQESSEQGIGYQVVNERSLSESELHHPLNPVKPLIIAPVVYGAGGNTGKIIAGVGLIAASAFMPASISLLGLSIASSTVGLIGASLLLGGVSRMLSPQQEKLKEKRSYSFNGAVNNVGQGKPVPLCYGRLRVGSQTISTGITTAQI